MIVIVAWFELKAVVPGEETVRVQVAAEVAVMSVLPFTRHGPDSEMLAGAPDPVVVNSWSEVLAAAVTVPFAGHAAPPWTPMEIGSAAGAGRTLMV